jgi:hypothetical protein
VSKIGEGDGDYIPFENERELVNRNLYLVGNDLLQLGVPFIQYLNVDYLYY